MDTDSPESWRFYGRAEELQGLARQLAPPLRFGALAIQGRRGIGKTALLVEAGRRAADSPPVLIFELLNEIRETDTERVTRLVDTVRATVPNTMLAGFPPPSRWSGDRPDMDFVDLVHDLLNRGVVIGIDEFHLARPLGLDAMFKMMIDRASSVNGTHPPSLLYVMGSHQQQIRALFACDQPLHQRVASGVALKAWRVPTVLEMAHEQGFLDYPERFLTLWTAFGGIPRLWEDFVKDRLRSGLPDMARWSSDRDWRMAFIEHHATLLDRSLADRFDDKATIELSEPQRTILLYLGYRRPRGDLYDRVLANLGKTIDKSAFEAGLQLLVRHLELLEIVAPFDDTGPPRLQVADNTTLFQLHIFPELWSGFERVKDAQGPALAKTRLRRLETLEGLALERLAEGALRATHPDDWVLRNAWNRCQDGLEVDLLVFEGDAETSGSILTMASCKRNPDRHQTPSALKAAFTAFLDQARPRRADLVLPSAPHHMLLVSPTFTREQHEHHAASGLRTLDIRSMAQLCGMPPPSPMPISAAPERA